MYKKRWSKGVIGTFSIFWIWGIVCIILIVENKDPLSYFHTTVGFRIVTFLELLFLPIFFLVTYYIGFCFVEISKLKIKHNMVFFFLIGFLIEALLGGFLKLIIFLNLTTK